MGKLTYYYVFFLVFWLMDKLNAKNKKSEEQKKIFFFFLKNVLAKREAKQSKTITLSRKSEHHRFLPLLFFSPSDKLIFLKNSKITKYLCSELAPIIQWKGAGFGNNILDG